MTALPDLRTALTDGIARRRTRLRRRASAAVAGAAALGAGAALVLVGGAETPPDALAIAVSRGSIELRITDSDADAEQLTQELRDAGIRGEIRTVPVVDVRVGTWVAITAARTDTPPAAESEPVLGETHGLGEIKQDPAVIRLPAARTRNAASPLLLYAGRAARPGERPRTIPANPTPGRDTRARTPRPQHTPERSSDKR